MLDLIGQDIGRYHIIEQLGQGGMATVYKAYDNRLERQVAIKFIRREAIQPEKLEQTLKRFEREAKALARFSHPNIVKVYDYGEHEGSPYLVMEYLQGGTLKAKIGRPLSPVDAARLLLPVARALDYAHRRNIIHRDVKPANILISEDGEPLLSDFGIAKILEADDVSALTGTGIGIGTPEYMAPEQGVGKQVDHRADIYALGIVFYELITGHKPYQADTPMAIVLKHIREPLPRPRDFVPDLSDETEQVIFKALAKNPDERYQNMGEFIAALEKITGVDTRTVTGSALDATITQMDATATLTASEIPGGTAFSAGGSQLGAPVSQPFSQPMSQPGFPATGFSSTGTPLPGVAIPRPTGSVVMENEGRQSGKPSRWLWILLAVAVLGVLGIIFVVGGLGVLYNIGKGSIEETTAALVAEQSTQTALSNITAATPAVTFAFAQETPTQEPSATLQELFATPTPPVLNKEDYLTATVSPENILAEAQKWPVIFTDSFDNNTNQWSVGNDSDEWSSISAAIQNGVLQWKATAKKGFFSYKNQDTEPGSVFYLSTDIKQIAGKWKDEVGDYGLGFHLLDQDNLYYFSIDESGYYSLFVKVKGEWTPLLKYEQTDLIQTGDGAVNKLTVVGQGPYYDLFINDQFLNQVQDDQLEGGYIGIMIELFNPGDQMTVEFDNLEFRVP